MNGFANDPIENRDGTDPVLCIECDERPPMPGWERCDECNALAGERQDEANFAAYHGASSPQTSAERMHDAYNALAERRK